MNKNALSGCEVMWDMTSINSVYLHSVIYAELHTGTELENELLVSIYNSVRKTADA